MIACVSSVHGMIQVGKRPVETAISGRDHSADIAVLENQASSLPVILTSLLLLSVPYGKALPNMGRAFQFVDHRDGVILN